MAISIKKKNGTKTKSRTKFRKNSLKSRKNSLKGGGGSGSGNVNNNLGNTPSAQTFQEKQSMFGKFFKKTSNKIKSAVSEGKNIIKIFQDKQRVRAENQRLEEEAAEKAFLEKQKREAEAYAQAKAERERIRKAENEFIALENKAKVIFNDTRDKTADSTTDREDLALEKAWCDYVGFNMDTVNDSEYSRDYAGYCNTYDNAKLKKDYISKVSLRIQQILSKNTNSVQH
jgi:hypothetical protein